MKRNTAQHDTCTVLVMDVCIWEDMEGIPEDILNQSMELSIPVYNDLPQYPIEDLRKYF